MLALLLLGLWRLDALSLWRDEVSSIKFAKAPLGELLTIVGRGPWSGRPANMATLPVLHWLAIGETEARVRLLSCARGGQRRAGLFHRAPAERLAGGAGNGIFALLYASSTTARRPEPTRWRCWSRLPDLAAPHPRRALRTVPWLAYGLLAALGLYVHFFVAFVVAAHGLCWYAAPGSAMARHRRRRHSGADRCGAYPADDPRVRRRAEVDPPLSLGRSATPSPRWRADSAAACAGRSGVWPWWNGHGRSTFGWLRPASWSQSSWGRPSPSSNLCSSVAT